MTERNVVWLEGFSEADVNELVRGHPEQDQLGRWLLTASSTDAGAWAKTISIVAEKLWDKVFDPVTERLTELGVSIGAHLVILAQGDLVLLPLHVAGRQVGGQFRRLLDDYQISFGPSARSVEAAARRANTFGQQPGTLLLVANPTGDLPHAEAEADAIVRVLDSQRVAKISGQQATLNVILPETKGARWLHFCCHGYHEWGNPALSGLLLANHDVVTISTILAQFDLTGCRLATLSACDSGVVDIGISPDEQFGLSSAFLQAGAAAVISTLWPVQDFSTMLLMEKFYETYVREKRPIAAALRQAQLWLRDLPNATLAQILRGYRDTAPDRPRMAFETARTMLRDAATAPPGDCPFRDPYYWGGFMVLGN